MPEDKSIELKEQEKVDNYTELRLEVKKIWNLSQAVPVVLEALGVTSKRLKDWLKKLSVKSSIGLLERSIVLNCKNCKASPRDLRLLGATCFLENDNNDKETN